MPRAPDRTPNTDGTDGSRADDLPRFTLEEVEERLALELSLFSHSHLPEAEREALIAHLLRPRREDKQRARTALNLWQAMVTSKREYVHDHNWPQFRDHLIEDLIKARMHLWWHDAEMFYPERVQVDSVMALLPQSDVSSLVHQNDTAAAFLARVDRTYKPDSEGMQLALTEPEYKQGATDTFLAQTNKNVKLYHRYKISEPLTVERYCVRFPLTYRMPVAGLGLFNRRIDDEVVRRRAAGRDCTSIQLIIDVAIEVGRDEASAAAAAVQDDLQASMHTLDARASESAAREDALRLDGDEWCSDYEEDAAVEHDY